MRFNGAPLTGSVILTRSNFMKKYKLNKKAIKVSALDENDEKEYWRSKTPIDRLKAVEINRRIVYGDAHTSQRFQRFLEVAQLKKN